MTAAALGGVVFDTAAVIGWANQVTYAHAVAWATVSAGNTIVVPSTVLAAARARVRPDRMDILEVLLALPHTVIPILDRSAAVHLGATVAADPDAEAALAAGHAVAEAVARDWPCLTDRSDRLRTLDPRVIADPLP